MRPVKPKHTKPRKRHSEIRIRIELGLTVLLGMVGRCLSRKNDRPPNKRSGKRAIARGVEGVGFTKIHIGDLDITFKTEAHLRDPERLKAGDRSYASTALQNRPQD